MEKIILTEKTKQEIYKETIEYSHKEIKNLKKDIEKEVKENFSEEDIKEFLQYNEMLIYQIDTIQDCKEIFWKSFTKETVISILKKNPLFDFNNLKKAKKDIRKDEFTNEILEKLISETNLKNMKWIVYLYREYKYQEEKKVLLEKILEIIKKFESKSSERIDWLIEIATTRKRTLKTLEEYIEKLDPEINYNIVWRFQKALPNEDIEAIIQMVKNTKINWEKNWLIELVDKNFLENIGVYSAWECENFFSGKKTSQEIFTILKTKNRDFHEHFAIARLYKNKIPEILKMVEIDKDFPIQSKILLMTSYKSIKEKSSLANEFYPHLKDLWLIKTPIQKIIDNAHFIKRVLETEPNSPMTSLFSIAIALKRNLSKEYSEIEFKEKLEKILEIRKKFREFPLAWKDIKWMVLAYTIDQWNTWFTQNNRDFFNPKPHFSLLKKAWSIYSWENERWLIAKKNIFKNIEESNQKIFLTIAWHGIENWTAVDLWDARLTVDELFDLIKNKALSQKSNSKLILNFFFCYSYDFASTFLNKRKNDPEISKLKLLPPTIITNANKGHEHLLTSDHAYEILDSEKTIWQSFSGKDMIEHIERINFIGGKWITTEPILNDMWFFFATPEFRSNDLIEIGQNKIEKTPENKA